MSYFDLELNARRDPVFRSGLIARTNNIDRLETAVRSDPRAAAHLGNAMKDFIRYCHFNPGFLTSYFFPNYIDGEPMSLMNRPFAFSMMNYQVGGSLTIAGSRQIAKCRPLSSDDAVMGYNGRPLYPEDLKEGLSLVGVSADMKQQPQKIVAIHKNASQKVFKIVTRKGGNFSLTADHPVRTVFGYTEVKDLKPGSRVAALHSLPVFGSRAIERDRIILTAYMIGDGCCLKYGIGFTQKPSASLTEFCDLAQPLQALPLRKYQKKNGLAVGVQMSWKNKLVDWLKEDGLYNKKSAEKRIPEWVFDLNKEDTCLFLSRLWATDGTVKVAKKLVNISYTTVSKRLAADVRALLVKLGVTHTAQIKKAGYRNKSGIYIACQSAHCIRVETAEGYRLFDELLKVPDKRLPELPVRKLNNNRDTIPPECLSLVRELSAAYVVATSKYLPAKLRCRASLDQTSISFAALRQFAESAKSATASHPHWKLLDTILEADIRWDMIVSIIETPEEPTWDIETDGEHNYVLEGVVCHNSSTFGARQLMMTHMYPGFRSLYVTPHSAHKKTYADKLMEMSRAFRFNKVPSKYRQNLYYKEFPGGGMIKLIYALTSAMAARGNTVDEILFDEYQNFDSSLEDAILEAQKNSRIPSVVYAGTAITTDTALEAKYQQSSKGVFMLRCGCGEWLNTGDRDTVLNLIQPEGITCPKCSRVQDVRKAELVHECTEMLKARRVGMRVPQIIVPQFIDDAVEYGRLYAKKASGVNLNSLLQENLAIPVEEGGREITQKDLENMCTLVQAECKKKAREGRYKFVVGGVDYGGSDYNAATKTKKSFTVHSVQGVNHDNTIEIIHFQEYAGMSYDDISDMIIDTHFDLKCSNLATDLGAGEVYRDRIRTRLGDWRRHFIFGYVGPRSAPVGRPNVSELQNHYSLNRTESLSALFNMIKSGRMRCFQWPLASRFLLDFLNLFRGLDDDHHGSTKWTYRKHGTKTDDSLHSINFGHTLVRLMLDEPLIPDRKLRDEVLSALRRNNNTVPGISRRHGHVSG